MSNTVKQFLEQLGLMLDGEPTLDGRIHRVPTRAKPHKENGWYVGHEIPRKICIAGDWGESGAKETFVETKTDGKPFSKTELKRIHAETKKLREAAEAETAERARLVAAGARETWEKASREFSHPYLIRKGLSSPFGTRLIDGEILVPTCDETGEMTGYQWINDEGCKQFLGGQRFKGTAFFIPGHQGNKVYLCEGFATGASIHMATGATVCVAFSAGNLLEVAPWLRKKYPTHLITVAADNDAYTPGNPGVQAARKAAESALGALAIPRFQEGSKEKKLTDFNDLHIHEGLEVVARQLGDVKIAAKRWAPLGKMRRVYYFFDYRKNKIREFSNFSTAEFYELDPLAVWAERYPPEGEGKGRVDWEVAKSDLIQASDQVGAFDPRRVRGAGVWEDRKRIVYNTGGAIYLMGDESPVDQSHIDLEYCYTFDRSPLHSPVVSPLSPLFSVDPLQRAVSLLNWADPLHGYYFLGWLAVARIAGALTVRPHMWLTGPSQAGKSTVLERIVDPLLKKWGEYVSGTSTEAGIRQAMQRSSVPLIFDEFESTDDEGLRRLGRIIEMLRSTWGQTGAQILKGSKDGIASGFSLQAPALVASIRVTLNNDADQSRFTVVELKEHGSNPEQWQTLKRELAAINEDFGKLLFSRMFLSIDRLTALASRLEEALVRQGLGQRRWCQQHGLLLAAYFVATQDHDPSDEEVFSLFGEHHEVERPQTDQEKCLDHLMHHRFRFASGYSCSVAKAIEEYEAKNPLYLKELPQFGILVDSEGISIANAHPALTECFKGTRWVMGWSKTLNRLPGATTGRLVKFCGKPRRATYVPRSAYFDLR